jgi:hypothetical protein
MAGSQHYNGPTQAQSTGAIVLDAAELSGGQFVTVINDGPAADITTIPFSFLITHLPQLPPVWDKLR